jgi:hypothetical protein
MGITLINKEQISSIGIFYKSKVAVVNWQDERKYWFFTYKEGYYISSFYSSSDKDEIYTKEELESGKWENTKYIVEDKKVYWYPFIEMRMNNGTNHTKKFETKEQLDRFLVNNDFNKEPYIELNS